MNSCYDPDYTFTGGSCAAFGEWSTLYNYYRVLEFSYEVEIVNLEAFPILVAMAPVSAVPSISNVYDIAELPLSKKGTLSAKGGQDRRIFRGKVLLSRFLGSQVVYYSDGYASTVNSNPSLLAYFVIGLNCDGSHTLTNGAFATIRLRYLTTFFKKAVVTG